MTCISTVGAIWRALTEPEPDILLRSIHAFYKSHVSQLLFINCDSQSGHFIEIVWQFSSLLRLDHQRFCCKRNFRKALNTT